MSAINSLNKCPNCHANELRLNEAGKYVCLACESEFSASQIEGAASSNAALAAVVSSAIREIDSPDSALIYLDTFFDQFDWDSYLLLPDIYIDDLRVMVEKNKVKRPADAKTWQLEVAAISYPLEQKLAALNKLQNKILENYNGDISDVADDFGTYNSVAAALEEERDALIKVLNADLANMARFGASEEDQAKAKAAVARIKEALEAIGAVGEVEDFPAYKENAKQNEEKLIYSYKARGIDAVQHYENGVAAFEAKDYGRAISYFEQIRDFRDTAKLINYINTAFQFGEILEAGGKLFKVEPHKSAAPDLKSGKGCGCKKKKKEAAPVAENAEEEEVAVTTYDLFEINNTVVAKKPAVAGFSEIVHSYGDHIYYIKGKKELCVYTVSANASKVLDTSKHGYSTKDSNSMGFTFAKDKLYLKKVLVFEEFKGASGCFSKKKNAAAEEEYNNGLRNNYSMIVLNLSTATVSVAIESMVTCICLRDLIFYTVSEVVSEDKHHHKTYANKARMYNVATGSSEVLFEKNCEILGVSGTKVVYDTWTPNSLNRSLHVIDYETHEDVLLENNVYQFIHLGSGKVLYTVGNKQISTLYSIDFDGQNRKEVHPRFSSTRWKVAEIIGNWAYMIKDSIIIKVSIETGEMTVLALDIKEIVRISGNYVYYISTGYDFRIVRLDGKDNLCIAPELSPDDISIGVTQVYYLRKEWTGNKNSKSLYCMDSDGHNVSKVLFDVKYMKDRSPNLPSSSIYVLKDAMRYFRIKIGENTSEESFKVSTYYTLNKATGEQTVLMELGLPTPENYHTLSKKGCFGKKKPETVVIEEFEREVDYGQLTEEEGKAFNLMNALASKPENGAHSQAAPGSAAGTQNGCANNNNKKSKGCGCANQKK